MRRKLSMYGSKVSRRVAKPGMIISPEAGDLFGRWVCERRVVAGAGATL
jgi:hypothetical protein